MSLLISIIFIIAAMVVNFMFILSTRKYKCYKPVKELGHKAKIECITLLNGFWKKEILIVAIGITLCFLSIFIDVNNKIILGTFISLSVLYSFISLISGIYNYKSFNKGISNLLNKISK
ncbi:MAG: hypothetical protein HUJ77_09775 [Clostridium sp.]|uniref:hypothetical protein n=1 Tax=Clostridium sp. TaxID=1506 RepID=UPI0025C19D0C|nr:hypothetical protein [Clostridium sp.]MCF0148670.1 hypothetical protein [Clostridium sp.]